MNNLIRKHVLSFFGKLQPPFFSQRRVNSSHTWVFQHVKHLEKGVQYLVPDSSLPPEKIKVVECCVVSLLLLCAAILQTLCQQGTDKQRNKGFSEALLKCLTEPQCFSNHNRSRLTKSAKTVKNTLKQHDTQGLFKKSKFRGKFLPYSVYKLLS